MNARKDENTFSLFSQVNNALSYVKTQVTKTISTPSNAELITAIKNQNLNEIKKLCENSAVINVRDAADKTAIFYLLDQPVTEKTYSIFFHLILSGATLNENKDKQLITIITSNKILKTIFDIVTLYLNLQTRWFHKIDDEQFETIINQLRHAPHERKIVFQTAWRVILKMSNQYLQYLASDLTVATAKDFFINFQYVGEFFEEFVEEIKNSVNQFLILTSHASQTKERRQLMIDLFALSYSQNVIIQDYSLTALSSLFRAMLAANATHQDASFEIDRELMIKVTELVRERIFPPAYAPVTFSKPYRPQHQAAAFEGKVQPSAPELKDLVASKLPF